MGKDKVEVVDGEGRPVGSLGERVGEGYAGIERGDVTWFVPEGLLNIQALGPSILNVEPGDIERIDLLP